jgi:hypothetical protein
MPMKNPEDIGWSQEVAPFVLVEGRAEAHLLGLGDPHLRLVQPLISRKALDRKVTIDGDHTEAQTTVEFVGGNGVRYVVDAILRATKTDRTDEQVLTMYTQIFASRHDTFALSTDVGTLITHYIKGTPELGCRWDELHITRVDARGAHRSPVARVRTFL